MEIIQLLFDAVATVSGIVCAYFAYKTYKNDHKD